VLGALMATNGFLTTPWNIVTVSLGQQIVPSDLLGRVNSVYRMLGWGLIPLGALPGGLLAHELGLRAPYPIAGVLRGIALLVAAPPVLIRAMREMTAQPTLAVSHQTNRDRLHVARSCDRARQFAKLSQLGETADFASCVK